jgi:transcriptional regulator of acetoin/glycerol metabolism
LHAATGGTLFLDEIGEMPLSMQTSLLRVLESGTYLRVGETRESRADVRVVCATCKNLVEMVKVGSFRNDLYFRLKGVILRIPPLRERRDRVALAQHLLSRWGEQRALTPALVRFLETHAWPGNVRELRTVLEVVRVLAGEAPELDVTHLPPDLAPPVAIDDEPELVVADPLAAIEASVVGRALDELGGNVSAAARQLGVARSTVYRMMERYGLKKG